MDALQQGTILQGKTYQYKIDKVLGQGSFGITYLAMMKTTVAGPLGAIDTEVKVAVKEFFMRDINGRKGVTVTCGSDGSVFEHYKRKFYREALNLSNLKHPNIIKVTEYFEANNTVYYVMEYINGGNLNDYITKKGSLSQNEAVDIIKQVGVALASMHEKKMLHLDVKPSNIMLRENGEPVLIDFGLSKKYDENGKPEESTTVGAGTPGYAPLEQINYREGEGKTFPVTMDVYALGATLFKMLVGYVPKASTILNDGFPFHELLSRNVSDELAACIAKAMALAKKNRFQTVKDFLTAIDNVKVEKVGKVEEEVKEEEEEEEVEVFPFDEEEKKPYDGGPKVNKRDHFLDPEPKEKTNFMGNVKKIAMYLAVVALGMTFGAIIYLLISNLGKSDAAKPAPGPKPEPTPVKPKDDVSDLCNDGNHPHAIDLGLQSGTKWACCNVGATSPEGYGDYYAWGVTRRKNPKEKYNDKNYDHYRGDVNKDGWGVNDDYFIDLGIDISGSERYDVAYINSGGEYKMPTKEQISELLKECTWEWITVNDIKGIKFTSKKKKDASIFLPAGGGIYNKESDKNEKGFYWSSNSNEKIKRNAYYLSFDKDSVQLMPRGRRGGGHLIRPVKAPDSDAAAK